MVEDDDHNTIRALLVVLDGQTRVWINTHRIGRATAERWARRQVAAGKLFALWGDDEAA